MKLKSQWDITTHSRISNGNFKNTKISHDSKDVSPQGWTAESFPFPSELLGSLPMVLSPVRGSLGGEGGMETVGEVCLPLPHCRARCHLIVVVLTMCHGGLTLGAPPCSPLMGVELGCKGNRGGRGIWKVHHPATLRHSTMTSCLCGVLGFFHKRSWFWRSLLLSLQAVFSQPTALSSLGRLSKPPFQHPDLLCSRRYKAQAGMRRATAQTMCALLTLPCLPQTTLYGVSLGSPEGPFLSQLIFPPSGVFSECGDLPLPSALLCSCLLIPLFFFLSFLIPSCQGIFLVLLGVPSFLPVFSRCSVNCSICRCIFDVLVRRDEFHILLFGHLDSSTSYTCWIYGFVNLYKL